MGMPGQKSLTFEERVLIEKYVHDGKTCKEIAALIGRSKSGVAIEIRRGGRGGKRNKFYCAKTAQEISDENLKNRHKNISKAKQSKKMSCDITQRIENIEMQIEILQDALREIIRK